jgi:hypothetical protein
VWVIPPLPRTGPAAEPGANGQNKRRPEAWRILVGEDATMIDKVVRAKPEASYGYAELFRDLAPASAPSEP